MISAFCAAFWSLSLQRPPNERSNFGVMCQVAFANNATSLYVESRLTSAGSGMPEPRSSVPGVDRDDFLVDARNPRPCSRRRAAIRSGRSPARAGGTPA